jgi:hypothetical protein
MEVELNQNSRLGLLGLGLSLGCLFLLLMSMLGRPHTPEPKLFTWLDFQVWQGERAYQRELATLRREAEGLVALLTASPQPVRAQLQVVHLKQVTAAGVPALHYQRQLLLEAGLAVEAWTVGAGSYESAQEAVEILVESLLPPTSSASPPFMFTLYLPLVVCDGI